VTRRTSVSIALGALVLALAALSLLPMRALGAQGSACSSGCKAAYGSCYKKSQERAKCQSQLQRCLEYCIRSKRKR
jgi:hypothetical protein